MPRVSVVTLTWNHLQYTKKAVESLAPLLTEEDEWIFCDNLSKDGTPEYLDALKLPCKKIVLYPVEHTSISQAYNLCIKASSGDYVFIWDNDLEAVMPDTLTHMLSVFGDRPGTGIVCPCLPNVVGRLRECVLPSKLCKEIREISCKHNRPYPMCVSAAWLLSRACIEKVGLFDEQFDKYGILDFDYAKRVIIEGFKIFSDGYIWVQHYGSITANTYLNIDILRDMHEKFAKKWSIGVFVPRWRRKK